MNRSQRNNFLNICRICAKKSSDTLGLFGIRKQGILLADMISVCTEIKIQQTDNRPSNICVKCISQLVSAFEFRKMAQDSEKKFQSMPVPSEFICMSSDIDDADASSDMDYEIEPSSSIDYDKKPVKVVKQEKPPKKATKVKRSIPSPTEVYKHFLAEETKGASTSQRQLVRGPGYTVHRAKISYECYKCKRKLKSFMKLREHMGNHLEFTPNECKICGMFFSDENFAQHLCRGNSVQCEYCSQSFNTTLTLLQHLETKQCQMNLHRCNSCPKQFVMSYLLKCHSIRHAFMLQRFVCNVCGKGYAANYQLTQHKKSHSDEKPHLCSECGLGFKTTTALRNHAIRHTSNKPFACPQCPYRFYDKRALKFHMDIHTDKKFICDTCGGVLKSKPSLDEHIRRIHRPIEKVICEICSLPFKSNHNLKRHMLTHTGEKPLKCKYCERTFRQSGDYHKHLKTHVGDNIYQCEFCPQAFPSKSAFRAHSFEHGSA